MNYEQYEECMYGKKWQFSSIVPKFSQICKVISNNFENISLEQIIIDKYTVGNLNYIDIYENIVTFIHILICFNGKITLIAKKHSYLHGINMKNPKREKSRVVPAFWYKEKIVK